MRPPEPLQLAVPLPLPRRPLSASPSFSRKRRSSARTTKSSTPSGAARVRWTVQARVWSEDGGTIAHHEKWREMFPMSIGNSHHARRNLFNVEYKF